MIVTWTETPVMNGTYLTAFADGEVTSIRIGKGQHNNRFYVIDGAMSIGDYGTITAAKKVAERHLKAQR